MIFSSLIVINFDCFILFINLNMVKLPRDRNPVDFDMLDSKIILGASVLSAEQTSESFKRYFKRSLTFFQQILRFFIC